MRLHLVIVALAAIAVGLVHIRRNEISANHRIQQLQVKQIYQRRKLYDEQVKLGKRIAPKKVRGQMEDLDIGLTGRVVAPPTVAHRLAAEDDGDCE